MRLYDTATKTYRQLQPGKTVKIYVCGITPYDSAHLGHIFTFMTYDLLQRRLEDLGHEVQMVRNITDVDEPIYAKAAELKLDYRDLAEAEIASFHSVLELLNFRPLFREPKASEYIDKIAAAVQQLVTQGYGYSVGNDIYFDTSKATGYGSFSGYNHKLLTALSKARGGNPGLNGKRQPLDFLLWRGIHDPADPAQWQTVVGNGRPGWHIECSVMSSDILGNRFDIHGGGNDLIFPHHESEIAQGLALNHTAPAHNWLHVSALLLAGEKMSKSLGNMVFAKDLLGKYDAGTIRLALMHYHHRIGGEWQSELLCDAEKLLCQVRETARYAGSDAYANKLLQDVRKALDDDLNTLEVVDALHRFVREACNAKRHTSVQHHAVTETFALLGL